MEKELVLKNITKRYPGVTALDNVSIEFEKGEIHALVGENGAGKSTMIKVISGAISPDEGEIEIEGKSYKHLTPILSRDAGVAVVYQELVQMEAMSVTENVFMSEMSGGKNKKLVLDRRGMKKRAEELLSNFGVSIDPNAPVGSLSTACRQVVEIAKAVSQNARIVIFDEPTAALTMEEQQNLFQIIHRLKAQGVTVIYISHRLDEIFEICDRVTVLRDGQYVTTKNTSDTNKIDLINLMVGRELKEIYPEHGFAGMEVMLRAEHMSGNGVEDISFELHKGEILGFAGLVGAGRTELMQLIYGAAKKTGGEVFLNGEKLHIKHPADALEKRIGLIPEDRKIQGCFLGQEIAWNIAITNIRELSHATVVNTRKENKQAEEYVERLKIKTPSIHQLTMNLSGGNQQKVVLAKVLASKSDIIIFDEPTRGIDVGARFEIYSLMVELAKQGKAIIMVSSDMEELLGMSDRILVLHEGKLAGALQRDAFSQDKVLQMASGL